MKQSIGWADRFRLFLPGALAAVGSFVATFAVGQLVAAPIDTAILAVVVSVSIGSLNQGSALRRLVRATFGLAAVVTMGIGLHTAFHEPIEFFAALSVLVVASSLVASRGTLGKEWGTLGLRVVGALLFFPAPMAAHLSTRPRLVALAAVIAFGFAYAAGFFAREGEKRLASAPSSWSVTLWRAGQQASAMALTLGVGAWLVPTELPWAFISAYLISTTVRTRAELVVKGTQRLLGAFLGALLGVVGAPLVGLNGPLVAIVMLTLLLLALFLRAFSYAWWSAGVTLLLSLVYGLLSPQTPVPVVPRLVGIALGACSAVIAAYVLVPLPTRRILKGMLKRVLASLDDLLASWTHEPATRTELLEKYHAQVNQFLEACQAGAVEITPARWQPARTWMQAVSRIDLLVDKIEADPALSAAPLESLRVDLAALRKALGTK